MAKKKKLYYKIGEACKQLDIQPYVLRYWETEFPSLNPNKSKSGQRVYNEKDLQIIGRIKELLYEEGFTIAGAKKKLEADIKTGLKPRAAPKAKPKARPKAAPKTETAAKKKAEPAAASEAPSDEVQRLRQGIENALDEARDLLALLDSKQKSG